jgi:ubiquitin-protein ligase E3 C
MSDTLDQFVFLGRVLGKAVFEDILVEPQFSPTFLNKLLGKDNIIDDLYTLDPEVYHNLVELKSYAAQSENSLMFYTANAHTSRSSLKLFCT